MADRVDLDELANSLRNAHVELKGAQLMIFSADSPEKSGEAFKCVGGVVSWLMKVKSLLRWLKQLFCDHGYIYTGGFAWCPKCRHVLEY